ncbi:uncharacterized protein LOC136096995 [Hydra vulgaris]|uniref:uncharacterized protein LOC136096995 n=1 Tax=Hydra vulgaris TaxID=6087 RepID=UPI0032EA18E1
MQSVHPPINEELKNDIDTKLANFFYPTGISFRLVESEVYKDFVKSLNPSYASVIPKAKALSGSLLEKQYIKCSIYVNEILNSETNLTLMSDGWTNIRGDHIVNFCIKAPKQKPFFYTSINTSGIIQNSSAVAAAILQVIEKIGSQKFTSFISDNAPVMKSAWSIIEEKYPHISASGCGARGVNLLVKDIVSTIEATKTVKDAEKIIKYLKNHHIVKAKFDERRIAANISLSLSMPVSTRWFSYYKSMSSLQLSKYVLIKLVDKESPLLKEIQPKNTSAAVMALIKSNPFWDRLSKLVKSIEFLSNVIGKLESDTAPLSFVYDYFGQMYHSYMDNKDIQQKVQSRLDFLFTPCIGIAFILTPKNAAEGLYLNEDKPILSLLQLNSPKRSNLKLLPLLRMNGLLI